MYLALFFVSLTLVYTSIQLILVLTRNHKAHQFFKTRAPHLPVVGKLPNIFAGHLFDVVLRDKNVGTITQLHEQLGPTFGFFFAEQPWVSTKNLELIKLIFMDQPHKHINRASFNLPFKEHRYSILQISDEAWRRTRRAVAPALTQRIVRSYEVSQDIESVLAQLKFGIDSKLTGELTNEQPGPRQRSMILDASNMFQRYTLAVIFLLLYRRERVVDFCSERDIWVDRIEESARQIKNPFVAASIMFPFARPLVEFANQFHPIGKLQAQIVDFIIKATDINRVAREQHQRIQKRLSETTGCKARPFSELQQIGGFKRRLIDTFIDALIEKRVEYDEFIGTTVMLQYAGFETTADTITCLVWHLAREPRIQEHLRQSVASEGLDSEYLHWCVMETVRYHPAVPLGTGRILGEDVTLPNETNDDGRELYLPKGTYVMPSIHSIHHDAKIWPQPEQFKPERWREMANFHPAAFMGFGLGPRNCVGGKLALQEIKLVIEMLLEHYRIELCSETPHEYNFSSPGLVYTIPDVPIKVCLVELNKTNDVDEDERGADNHHLRTDL